MDDDIMDPVGDFEEEIESNPFWWLYSASDNYRDWG
jgi:hypothetical protein